MRLTMSETYPEVTAVMRFLLALLPLALAFGPCVDRAVGSTIFSDNFSGPTLNPAWQVLPGQGSYSVGGGLQYYNDGPEASTTGWYNAALTLALPFSGTNWEIDTEATYSLQWCPTGQTYTGPAVPTPSCTSGAQGPEVLVAFNPGVPISGFGGPDYAGTDYALFQRDIDAYYGADYLYASYGAASNGNLLNPTDTGITNNIADGTYWLQIIRNGGTLTMNYSYDGTNYLTALSTTLSDPSSSYNELLLGGITYSTAGSYTDYHFVDIESTTTPEPGTFVPLSIGVVCVCLGWLWRKRRAT